MTNVVDLNARRLKQAGYISGQAKCLDCHHTWEAVTPIGTVDGLECPKCTLQKGILVGLSCRHEEPHFTCDCGNQYWFVLQGGVYCPCCGLAHGADDVFGPAG